VPVRLIPRCLIIGALAVAGAFGPVGSAAASTSCTYYPPPLGLIDVVLTSDDAMRLEVVGGDVQVQDGVGTLIPCSGGTATTAATATIDITDGSGTGIAPSFVTIVDPGELAGAKIDLDLRGGIDAVAFQAASAPLDLRLGAAGVNTNPVDLKGPSPDVDVSPGGVDEFRAEGSSGADRVWAPGAVGGDSPTTVPLKITANAGDDLLGGGEVSPDVFDGGSGTDTVSYATATQGVAGPINGQVYVNNTVTGLDTLTGIEALVGSPLGDELSGDGGPNTLKGGRGDDLIRGRGGKDRIFGGRGRDQLFGDLGIDALFAADRRRDAVIDCGGGSNRRELAKVDRSDPAPRSC